MNRKISSIGIYWKNDQPGGIGVMIGELGDDITEAVESVILINDDAWEKEQDRPALVKHMFGQLETFGQQPELGRKLWAVILGNVHLLVKHGYMPNDEYNGLVFMNELTLSSPEESLEDQIMRIRSQMGRHD